MSDPVYLPGHGPGTTPPADNASTTGAAQAAAAVQAAAAATQAKVAAAQQKAYEKTQAAQQRAWEKTQAAQQRAAYAQQKAVERSGRPVVKGSGGAAVAVALGISALLGAVALAAWQFDWYGVQHKFEGDLMLILGWLVATLVVIGLAIIISGMRGRRSGWLGFLAIIGLIAALPLGYNMQDTRYVHEQNQVRSLEDRRIWENIAPQGRRVTSGTVGVTDPVEAAHGFRTTFGDPVIDLTQLPLYEGDHVVVPINMVAGDLTVIVPQGIPVRADVRLGAGQARWRVDGRDEIVEGAGVYQDMWYSAAVADDNSIVTLVVQVNAGAGNVTITDTGGAVRGPQQLLVPGRDRAPGSDSAPTPSAAPEPTPTNTVED
ncbi:MAG: cell wall-active antibiotics response protein [Cellulomonadaceae bacterium]|jgi:hypothetical protein|nr:cell wall-active antibiotics response protein [Cellulomonadaceae bacterium]